MILLAASTNEYWLNEVDWKLIGVYVVPVLSAIASYVLGRLSNSIGQKQKVRAERYEKVYLPIIQILLERKYWQIPPHKAHRTIVTDFYPILSKNLGLLGKKSALNFSNFVMPLFTHKIDLGIKEDEMHPNPIEGKSNRIYQIPEEHLKEYDKTFNELVLSLLREGSRLSRKLKYPNISKTILRMYSEQEHE
ncbi:hypothetical protein [Lactobacillus plantarum] [Lactiplantibacillus mudanjiangensis]|uniref:hypothetical protein n=1 Tax=Lactiplantibacillus mudanjiangensis TaxID=1296538 RepID=UPI001015942D|nr:hypothetical protein [Lactiplantibacillus mudanjiangensis]VDG33340.1 hypothetical protein [Lactobacillus plantarum] [Lactiplantibacillus mudanjiangensis]